jgi:hypothetical protein
VAKGKSEIVMYRGGFVPIHEIEVLSDFSTLGSDPDIIVAISLPSAE